MAGSASKDGTPVYTQMEFAVRMTCQSCVDTVKQTLSDVPGMRKVYVDLDNELVLVETSLPSAQVQRRLETTGKLVIFRGFGGMGQQAPSTTHHGAAVAIMKGGGGVKGLARLVQVSPEQCVIEGTIDGLSAGRHAVSVHQYGDLSEGCLSCGEVYHTGGVADHPVGFLGTVEGDDSGRATFQMVSEQLKVWDIIGRSMVVHAQPKPQPVDRKMCGIIARSAGIFQNTKKVCTCDGVTIWDEARKSKESEGNIRAAL